MSRCHEDVLCLIKHHIIKTFVLGSRGMTPRILNLRTRWRWVVRRTGGPLSRSGHGGKERKSLPYLCRGSKPSRPAHNLVATLSELPWFLRKAKNSGDLCLMRGERHSTSPLLIGHMQYFSPAWNGSSYVINSNIILCTKTVHNNIIMVPDDVEVT